MDIYIYINWSCEKNIFCLSQILMGRKNTFKHGLA